MTDDRPSEPRSATDDRPTEECFPIAGAGRQLPDACAATGDIAGALEGIEPPGASASVLAVRSTDGEVVAARDPDRAVAPASNAKLFTAGLAMDRLGADYRFETSLHAGDGFAAGELDGDLVLVATGAPDLAGADLAALAEDAADHLDRVAGRLVADTSRFAGPQLGPGRVWVDAHHAYGARSSALALGGNVVEVTVEARGGDPAVVAPDCKAVTVELDVEVAPTGPDGVAPGITGRPARDGRGVRVEGVVPPGERRSVTVPVPAPVERCLRRLLTELEAAGVAVAGGVATDPPTAASPGRQLASVRSAPVRKLLRPMLAESDNLVAEQLARSVAAAETGAGSWECWTGVVDDHLTHLGVTAGRLRDGSGLSRYDRLTARGVVANLAWAADQPWGGALFDALPAPGEGTLADRLDGTDVVAKTGTLTGARALSGRVGGNDPVLFAILVGGITVDAEAVRDRQDELVRALAAVAEAD